MNDRSNGKSRFTISVLAMLLSSSLLRADAFEGYIHATSSRGGPPTALLYTVGTNLVRVELKDTNALGTVDILDRQSGTVTLLFPRNRCFMRLKPMKENPTGVPPGLAESRGPPSGELSPPPLRPPPGVGPTNPAGMTPWPAMPMRAQGVPPGIGSQAQSTPGPGGAAMPQMPVMPQRPGMGAVPAMPMLPPGGGLELKATGARTNLLNYTCELYEIKQWGQTMEIWATDQLLPFKGYLSNRPPRFGPPSIERSWAELIAAKGLFPLLASLTLDNGRERYHFEVQSVTPATLKAADSKDFQTPPDYVEMPAGSF